MSNADDWRSSHVQPDPDIIYAGLITCYAKDADTNYLPISPEDATRVSWARQ